MGPWSIELVALEDHQVDESGSRQTSLEGILWSHDMHLLAALLRTHADSQRSLQAQTHLAMQLSQRVQSTRIKGTYMGGSMNLGLLFGSPYNKSPTILGSILGPPIVGNSHMASISEIAIMVWGRYLVSGY